MKLTILLPFALLGFANATPQILPPPSNTWHERTFDPVRNGESAAAASFQEAARTVPDIELKYMFDLVKKAKGGLDAVKLGVGKPIDLKALKLFARDELRDSQSPSRVLSEEEVEAIIAEQYNSTASAELEKRDSRPESWHKVWADAAFRGRTEKLIWRDKQCCKLLPAITIFEIPKLRTRQLEERLERRHQLSRCTMAGRLHLL